MEKGTLICVCVPNDICILSWSGMDGIHITAVTHTHTHLLFLLFRYPSASLLPSRASQLGSDIAHTRVHTHLHTHTRTHTYIHTHSNIRSLRCSTYPSHPLPPLTASLASCWRAASLQTFSSTMWCVLTVCILHVCVSACCVRVCACACACTCACMCVKHSSTFAHLICTEPLYIITHTHTNTHTRRCTWPPAWCPSPFRCGTRRRPRCCPRPQSSIICSTCASCPRSFR